MIRVFDSEILMDGISLLFFHSHEIVAHSYVPIPWRLPLGLQADLSTRSLAPWPGRKSSDGRTSWASWVSFKFKCGGISWYQSTSGMMGRMYPVFNSTSTGFKFECGRMLCRNQSYVNDWPKSVLIWKIAFCLGKGLTAGKTWEGASNDRVILNHAYVI